jgi:hypothetical protein
VTSLWFSSRRLLPALIVFVGGFSALDVPPAVAGPPYVTDDPEPTEYRHWEIYTGLQYENDGGAVSASVPFAEFNYGAMPNVQVSISTQLTELDAVPMHGYRYGLTDFGIKTRFVQESEGRPQIAFYPSIQIPTAPGAHVVTLLPLWLQKSYGTWTAFGGGGLYLNAGPGMRDFTFVGSAVEHAISPATTVGVELFHQSAQTLGGTDTTAANLGMAAQIGKYHAILASFGRGLHGDDTFAAYASYEFALGPGGARK